MRKALDILKSTEKFHITLGLERIQKLMNLLDNPQEKYKIIHIAGTNGKGSTSKIINDCLIEEGYKVGLFTSPHLFSYCERIKINNEDILEYYIDILTDEIDKFAKQFEIELSEFELLTAVAFYYFYIKNVDYVVLETGLGGLYDATNIVKNPILEIITTIDFDHTERLGSTINEIALQKAGIIKENSKVVVSSDNLGYETIKQVADEKQAEILPLKNVKVSYENGQNFAFIEDKKLEFNLLGSHQAKNLSLALCALNYLNVSDNAIEKGLKNVSWKFRLEYDKEKNVLIDSAHNPSGAMTLRNFLDENFKDFKKTFVFGCLKNKNYNEMLDILIKEEDEFYFMEFDYPSSLKFEQLPLKWQNRAKRITSVDEVKTDNLKIFCGSIYMLGQIMN